MKRLIAAVAFFLAFAVQAAEPKKADGVSFTLDGVAVSQVVRVVFSEVLKTPYVLDPAVVGDSRPVSFRWDNARGDIKPFLFGFLDMLGYRMTNVGGVDLVRPKPEAKPDEEEKEVFVYRPMFRDGSYLVDLLGPLFKGGFTVRRSVQAPEGAKAPQQAVPAGSAAALIDRKADTLVFNGTEKEIARLQKVLPQVDVSSGEVLVRGVLYEVQTGKKEGSGLQLAASLISGKLSLGFGGTPTSGDNFVRLKLDSGVTVDAVLSALSSDSRFKVVSSPSLRVRSGAQAKITVGQDVPILGALSYPQGAGQAVQSVEYRSSGVIFDLSPDVRGSVVDLKVNQQVSNFVKTETGVNGSPTLTKRELATAVSMEDGEVIVLGGLNENKSSSAETGLSFLPSWMRSKTGEDSDSEILLILQVTKL